MVYRLFWKGEEIDTAETKQEAEYLQNEYNIAFMGGVSIKK